MAELDQEVVDQEVVDTGSDDVAAETLDDVAEVSSDISEESEGEAAEGQDGEEDGAQAAAAAYEPNFKFRVHNDEEEDEDGEEQEFDEFVRGAIKDKESEDRIRDLYTRAHGLDALKPRHQKLQERFSTVAQHYGKLHQTVQDILRSRDEGDYATFLEKSGVKVGALAEWLMGQIKLNNMSPEERRPHEELSALRREVAELRRGRGAVEDHSSEAAVSVYEDDFRDALRDPSVKKARKAYDERVGESGAFEEFVLDYGSRYYRKHGKNLRPAKAVRECLKVLGLESSAPSQGAQGAPSQGATGSGAARKVVAQPKTAFLPNTGSSAASATSKKPQSIKDLKKLANGGSL